MAGVEVHAEYLGGLRCKAVHVPSGASLLTDAPVDNHGRGESFSPTDLVAAALGTCILTIAGIAAERDGVELRGARCRVVKEMATEPHRRIGGLRVRVEWPASLEPAARERLERAVRGCPVHRSLSPDVDVVLEFG